MSVYVNCMLVINSYDIIDTSYDIVSSLSLLSKAQKPHNKVLQSLFDQVSAALKRDEKLDQ